MLGALFGARGSMLRRKSGGERVSAEEYNKLFDEVERARNLEAGPGLTISSGSAGTVISAVASHRNRASVWSVAI